MQHLGSHPKEEGEEPRGPLVVVHVLLYECRIYTRCNSGNRATQTGKHTPSPQGRKPSLDATDEARNNTRRSSKEKTSGHGSRISYVHRRAAVVDTELGIEYGNEAKDDPDYDLLFDIGTRPEAGLLLK